MMQRECSSATSLRLTLAVATVGQEFILGFVALCALVAYSGEVHRPIEESLDSAQELDCANQVFWLKQFFLAEVLPQVFLGGMSREQKLALPGMLAACPGPYNILQFRLLSSRLLRNPGRAVQPTAFRFASAYHRVPRSRIR